MTLRGRAALGTVCAAGLAAFAALVAPRARAQRFEAKRPQTWVVGKPRAMAATAQVDGTRAGRAATALPRGPFSIAWRRPLPFTSDRAPLVTRAGDAVVVGASGALVVVGSDGAERGRVALGAPATGAAALLSDDTIVVVVSSGDAVGVREGQVRFRVRVGEGRVASSRVAPLPLEDGGVAVAAGAELAVLDAEGNVRARRTLPEPPVAPLIEARGQVLAIGAGGAVYGWTPDREIQRLGTFGGPVDEAAAFDGGRQLVAVVAGQRVAALDLVRGTTASRAVASAGLYLGPPALGLDGSAHVFFHGATGTTLVAIRPDGTELGLTRTATWAAQIAPDGGPAVIAAPPHVGPLVDAAGTVLFASPTGWLGAVSGCAKTDGAPRCTVHLTGEAPCTRGPSRIAGGVVGVAPAGDGAVVIACEAAVLVRVTERAGPPSPDPTGAP